MKHLCSLSKKGVDENMKKIVSLIVDPKFICMKCARVSNIEDRLCKPKSIKKYN
jgi:hypothetical protein